MTETNFWKKLKKKLEAAGWLCEKIPQGRFKAGFPDGILIDPCGVTVYIELKVDSNVVSKLQEKKLRAIDRKGAVAIVGRYCEGATFRSIQEEREDGMGRESTIEYCLMIDNIWEDK